MKDGFICVAAGTPKIRVADCRYNAEQIFTLMREADKQGVKILALPELCLTGYTCADLFLQDTLLRGAEEGLQTILDATKHLEVLTALGMPVRCQWDNKLYNCAVVIQKGEILGLVPKSYIPNYGEFYEARWFASGAGVDFSFELCGQAVSLSTRGLFACPEMPDLVVGVEICEDLWAPEPPSTALARAGATVILNLSASNELVGKAAYRRQLVVGQSGRLCCGYVYADAGEGESTTDVVFTGHDMIAENGALLAQQRFATGLTIAEIDVERLVYERRRMNTFTYAPPVPEWWRADFHLTPLRHSDSPLPVPHPLHPGERRRPGGPVPGDPDHRRPGAEKAAGAHRGTDSGGGPLRGPGLHPGPADHRPGHGDAGPPRQRHHRHHHALLRHHGPDPEQRRPPGGADGGHAADHPHRGVGEEPLPGHRPVHGGPGRDVRERPGPGADPGAHGRGQPDRGPGHRTGDLSELALGWCTYNGDHMSMYAVNASIPKTLVRHLVDYVARDNLKKTRT